MRGERGILLQFSLYILALFSLAMVNMYNFLVTFYFEIIQDPQEHEKRVLM